VDLIISGPLITSIGKMPLQLLSLVGIPFDQTSIRLLSAYIEKAKFLDDLNLQKCAIGDQINILCEGLRVNRSIHVLNLEENHLGPQEGVVIAQVLEANTSLRELKLNRNEIGDSGLTAIAAALKDSNDTLRSLSISYNNIGDAGIFRLADALTKNFAIQSLRLGDETIGKQGALCISKVIEASPCIVILLVHKLAKGQPDQETSDLLLDAINNNQLIQSLTLPSRSPQNPLTASNEGYDGSFFRMDSAKSQLETNKTVYKRQSEMILNCLEISQPIGSEISFVPVVFKDVIDVAALNLAFTLLNDTFDKITQFRELKYLNIANTDVGSLPEFLTELKNLQTLNISGCSSIPILPKHILDMPLDDLICLNCSEGVTSQCEQIENNRNKIPAAVKRFTYTRNSKNHQELLNNLPPHDIPEDDRFTPQNHIFSDIFEPDKSPNLLNSNLPVYTSESSSGSNGNMKPPKKSPKVNNNPNSKQKANQKAISKENGSGKGNLNPSTFFGAETASSISNASGVSFGESGSSNIPNKASANQNSSAHESPAASSSHGGMKYPLITLESHPFPLFLNSLPPSTPGPSPAPPAQKPASTTIPAPLSPSSSSSSKSVNSKASAQKPPSTFGPNKSLNPKSNSIITPITSLAQKPASTTVPAKSTAPSTVLKSAPPAPPPTLMPVPPPPTLMPVPPPPSSPSYSSRELLLLVTYQDFNYRIKGTFFSIEQLKNIVKQQINRLKDRENEFELTFFDEEFGENVVLQNIEDLQNKMKLVVKE